MHFCPKRKSGIGQTYVMLHSKHLKTNWLVHPSFPILTQIDTSVGYVLGQLNDDKEYVIAYGGKSLSADQRKFAIEKDCLAVLTGIEAHRSYLVHGKFTVVTDY